MYTEHISLVKLSISALTLALIPISPGLSQEISEVPLYGTVNLEAGFLPDPYIVEIIPGGADSADHLGNDCVGYIENSQPDYDLNYESGGSPLGIFVESDIDTTLIINDPRGNWRCNDDAASLTDANPGIFFSKPMSGNYNIWVGIYDESSGSEMTFLAITEYDQNQWGTLEIGDKSNSRNIVVDGINFGVDSSAWANDGECDDPRFEGDGMATIMTEEDIRADATDCSKAFAAGTISVK